MISLTRLFPSTIPLTTKALRMDIGSKMSVSMLMWSRTPFSFVAKEWLVPNVGMRLRRDKGSRFAGIERGGYRNDTPFQKRVCHVKQRTSDRLAAAHGNSSLTIVVNTRCL